jgi:hypothetical protein
MHNLLHGGGKISPQKLGEWKSKRDLTNTTDAKFADFNVTVSINNKHNRINLLEENFDSNEIAAKIPSMNRIYASQNKRTLN